MHKSLLLLLVVESALARGSPESPIGTQSPGVQRESGALRAPLQSAGTHYSVRLLSAAEPVAPPRPPLLPAGAPPTAPPPPHKKRRVRVPDWVGPFSLAFSLIVLAMSVFAVALCAAPLEPPRPCLTQRTSCFQRAPPRSG